MTIKFTKDHEYVRKHRPKKLHDFLVKTMLNKKRNSR